MACRAYAVFGIGESERPSSTQLLSEPCDAKYRTASLPYRTAVGCVDPHPTRCPAFHFASGFATSRAQSMKSCATGLSVRFFRVTIPFGTRAIGSSTGKTLISGAPGRKSQCGSRENRDKAPGRQETNPHLGGIGDHGRAGIVEPAGAKGFHCDRPNHASRRRQHPRFVHQFGKLDPAPPSPRTLRTRRDDTRVIKEKFEIQSLVCNGAKSPYDQEIDVTLAQFAVQRLHISGHEMKHDARIAPGEPIDHGRNKARGQKGGASDPHFPGP